MDNGLDVVSTSLTKRSFNLVSFPYGTDDSSATSSPDPIFSPKGQSSQRSDISSTISSAEDHIQPEDDGIYFPHHESQGTTSGLGTSDHPSQHPKHQGGTPYPTIYPNRDNAFAISPDTLLSMKNVMRCSGFSDISRTNPTEPPLPPSCRQNPRRTQRPSWSRASNESGSANPRPPPQLIRQGERKDNFVEGLVGELENGSEQDDRMLTDNSLTDTTTQTIEAIWPLSTAQGRASTDQNLVGLRSFVQEVLKRSKTSYSTLLVAIYYLILIMPALPRYDLTMIQNIDSDTCRAMQCGRRMFLAALVLASKYLQDRNYSARAWSKISGLQIKENNTTERSFLDAIDWKLHFPVPSFQRWERIVLRYSPSSRTISAPRSSPVASQTWRSIVRQLNADLDQFADNGMLLSDNDSGYYSESSAASSRGNSPHGSRNNSVAATPETSAPVLPSLPAPPPLTLEPTPQDSKPDHRMLPPLQPREGLLPTPQITPQSQNFCTPAVSAQGLLPPRRSSMSVAMNEHRQCLDDKLLDRPNTWGISLDMPHRHFSRVPSSLSCTWSSPDSGISDMSQFSSRSSSISSAASLTCALPEPSLASAAMRRCAEMKISAFPDEVSISREESVTPTAPLPSFSTLPRHVGEDFHFKERPRSSGIETKKHSQDVRHVDLSAMRTSVEQILSDDSNTSSGQEDEELTPRPKAVASNGTNTPDPQTYQAANALVNLKIDHSAPARPLNKSSKAGSLKRGRPTSTDLGLQSSVRNLLRTHSYSLFNPEDNGDKVRVKGGYVADTWLPKGNLRNQAATSEESWADFRRKQADSENETLNREAADRMMRLYSQNSQSLSSSSESLPRKKPCCSARNSKKLTARTCSEETLTPKSLSVRKGGGNVAPGKATRKTSNSTKPKNRGARKPSAEMGRTLQHGLDDYVEMHDSALLYGEVPAY